MKWKGFGRKRFWSYRGTIQALALETEETHTKNRITSVPTEIRTEDHPNRSPK
jgi:hypothetical protein